MLLQNTFICTARIYLYNPLHFICVNMYQPVFSKDEEVSKRNMTKSYRYENQIFATVVFSNCRRYLRGQACIEFGESRKRGLTLRVHQARRIKPVVNSLSVSDLYSTVGFPFYSGWCIFITFIRTRTEFLKHVFW